MLTQPIGSSAAKVEQKKRGPSALADVVGIELGGGDERGCPAVRLVRRKGVWAVRALGFVKPPAQALPTSWKDIDIQPTWSLPSAFAAPSAALAVRSADQVVRQMSPEALADGEKGGLTKAPFSRDGLRLAVAPLGDGAFVLEAGLPEYQVLWLSRLFPEGHRPTAASVQPASAAMLSALAEQEDFNADGGNAAALFVTESSVCFVGYRNAMPVLLREFPGVGGTVRIREAVKVGLGLSEDKMVDAVMDDTLVDLDSVLRPLVNPILRQLELSLDYMKGRLGISVNRVFLMGQTFGAAHWNRLADELLGVRLEAPELFRGYEFPAGLDGETGALASQSHLFMVALGAARSAMEEQDE